MVFFDLEMERLKCGGRQKIPACIILIVYQWKVLFE
jgi:hypothetical protein